MTESGGRGQAPRGPGLVAELQTILRAEEGESTSRAALVHPDVVGPRRGRRVLERCRPIHHLGDNPAPEVLPAGRQPCDIRWRPWRGPRRTGGARSPSGRPPVTAGQGAAADDPPGDPLARAPEPVHQHPSLFRAGSVRWCSPRCRRLC